jgi:hypothetical protein
MADRKISDLTALTTPASGDFLPIVDISEAAAASKNKRITIEELMRGVPDGTAAAPGIAFETYPSTGVYSSGANQLAVATNGTGRLFIDATGNVGVGTSLPASILHVAAASPEVQIVGSTNAYLSIKGASGGPWTLRSISTAFSLEDNGSERLRITSAGLVGIGNSAPQGVIDARADAVAATRVICNNATIADGASTNFDYYLNTTRLGGLVHGFNSGSTYFGIDTWNGSAATRRLTITAGGNLGIGVTSPSVPLHVLTSTTNTPGLFEHSGSVDSYLYLKNSTGGAYIASRTNDLSFHTSAGATERARIDSSGRLLVGTSTARTNYFGSASIGSNFQVVGSTHAESSVIIHNQAANAQAPYLQLGKAKGTGYEIVSSGDLLGSFVYFGADGSAMRPAASIDAFVDGTPGANDMPGRLVFSVTADGASSPTERMRIGNTGILAGFLTGNNGNYFATSVAAGTTGTVLRVAYSATSNANDGTESFLVYSNGNVVNTNNSYGAISDIKLKENIVDAASQWNDIKALQVRKYNFKEGQTHTQIGLVAQEVELVSPGLVTESPDRDEDGNDLGTVTKSVNYSVLYMKAVKALQEAMERIETLEAKVAALESA